MTRFNSNNNSYNYIDSQQTSRWLIAVGGAAALIVSSTAYFLYQSIQEYGVEGTLHYIWEGDPYGPMVKSYLETLDRAERSRLTCEIQINRLEEALDRARLDSVDEQQQSTVTTSRLTNPATTNDMVVRQWIQNCQPDNLEKSLAGLSHSLDQLIAAVDGVVVSTNTTDTNGAVQPTVKVMQRMKKRKKKQSKQLVLLMERCDALLTAYQVLQEHGQ